MARRRFRRIEHSGRSEYLQMPIDRAAYFPTKEEAEAFERIFGMSMSAFYDTMHGFKVVEFDEALGTPRGVSTNQFVMEKYGKEGFDLMHKLNRYGASGIKYMIDKYKQNMQM